jgi:heme exporter protein A
MVNLVIRMLQILHISPIFHPHLTLSAQNLACVRGERQLFEGIHFTLNAGESLIVSGSNGVGKSSLLRIIAGLLRASKGDVKLENWSQDEKIACAMHYLGHENGLRDALTPRENLSFLFQLLGTRSIINIDAALGLLGILKLADLPVGVLSAGQKRRVALAGLVLCGRQIWVLDEPTTALDSIASGCVAELISNHCEQGGMVIAATHLPLGINAQNLRLGA